MVPSRQRMEDLAGHLVDHMISRQCRDWWWSTDSELVEFFDNSGVLADFEPFLERLDGIFLFIGDEIDAAKVQIVFHDVRIGAYCLEA